MRPKEGRVGQPSVVVLAAGESSRFPGAKQLAEIGGRSMVAAALSSIPPQVREKIVVLGHRAPEVRRAAAGTGARFVLNRRYRSGMSSSIRAGIRAVSPDSPGALILLADQPFVTKPLVRRILAAFAESGGGVVASTTGKVMSPPVAFPRDLFPELLALRGDAGAKSVIERHREAVLAVRAPESQLMDVDTPAAMRAARSLGERRKARK